MLANNFLLAHSAHTEQQQYLFRCFIGVDENGSVVEMMSVYTLLRYCPLQSARNAYCVTNSAFAPFVQLDQASYKLSMCKKLI